MVRPTTYTIFLSRPSDIESDIEVVKDAISDANSLAEPLGVRFDTFDWRENATPGIAAEPQARINAQADGCEVLIALLGATLGTPTFNYSSGCVEEIEEAIARVPKSTFGNDSVLIFFKDVTLNLSSNFDEAKRVQDLKGSLGPRGILYKQYGSDEKLRRGILRSLGVLLQSHISSATITTESPQADPKFLTPTPEAAKTSSIVLDDAEELGLMDYGQIADEDIQIATEAAEQVGAAMRLLGQIVSDKTPDITNADTAEGKARMREAISDVASAMEDCAFKVQSEGDRMSDSFLRCLSAIRSILDIQSVDLSPIASNSELQLAADMTQELCDTLDEVTTQISDFKETVTTLPRLTKELNLGKRRLLVSTENLVSTLNAIYFELKSVNDFARSSLGGTVAGALALSH